MYTVILNTLKSNRCGFGDREASTSSALHDDDEPWISPTAWGYPGALFGSKSLTRYCCRPTRVGRGSERIGLPPHQSDNSQDRAAAHRGSPFQLQAGPGTGKTRTLIKRVLSLLADGINADVRGGFSGYSVSCSWGHVDYKIRPRWRDLLRDWYQMPVMCKVYYLAELRHRRNSREGFFCSEVVQALHDIVCDKWHSWPGAGELFVSSNAQGEVKL